MVIVTMPVIAGIHVGQHLFRILCRLTIVKGLRVRQVLVEVQNVDDTGHVFVEQAHELEVACRREVHRERLSTGHRRRGHARRPIEGRRARGETRTSDREGRTHLSIHEERDGVDFSGHEPPGDAVADVNPDFVREKRERLTPQVAALRTDRRAPGCLRECQMRRRGKYQERQTRLQPS